VFKRKRSKAAEARSFKPAARGTDGPHTRPARRRLRDDEKPDQMAEREKAAESHQEALLDEGIEESFPGSDPVSANHFT
jgi:hypothetical protein